MSATETQKKQGKIQVQTDNIFPIIKKFLYSDNEIFLRELVSNAVDAIQKIKVLSSAGEFKGEIGDAKVSVSIDKEAKTLTISDHGVGMTAEEIEKYLNQVAFSGAREFLEKYKGVEDKQTIIGHFGLGFYSAFMVSEQVEVVSKSWQEPDKAHRWVCDGSPEYSLEPAERSERGTDIVLHISEENKEFLENERIKHILEKYGRFLPVPVFFEDAQINTTEPAWTKAPADLSQEDYANFYKELYPGSYEEPLFHIHLNVDYPFNLTGILYFPRITDSFDLQKKKISLYSNQVFITDAVEGVVPEFLTMLHGVLDSPDIPLNVSRSYLQADGNVRKISGHITKKVADKLESWFKEDREGFESKWEDIKLFVQYGTVTETKFADRSASFSLIKSTEGSFKPLEDWKEELKDMQTDKDGQLVMLYSAQPDVDHAFIERAKERGYTVFHMHSPIEAHYIGHLESKHEKLRFVRVDSDSPEKLIDKGIEVPAKLNEEEQKQVTELFEQAKGEANQLTVKLEHLSENDPPVVITEPEFMRRMQEMQQPGSRNEAFRMHTAVINGNHPLMKRLLLQAEEGRQKEVAQQALDLALLSKGLLKGEAMTRFMQRSVDLLH